MTPRTLAMTAPLYDYRMEVGFREPAALERVRTATASLPGVNMLLAPEQGQVLAFLARLINVRRYLEIGTYTGYSALALALALDAGAKIVTCEVDPSIAEVAKRHWQDAGVAEAIELRLGPALQTLDVLIAQGARASFDMAFIDADKENLAAYYERCHALVRPGGLILSTIR